MGSLGLITTTSRLPIKNVDELLTPDPGFLWKTSRNQGGEYLAPKDMATHHLFFTLRMIWNHTMPEDARSVNYKQYQFGPSYTKEYLVEAIKALTYELATRQDMQTAWLEELARMIGWLKIYQVEAKHG